CWRRASSTSVRCVLNRPAACPSLPRGHRRGGTARPTGGDRPIRVPWHRRRRRAVHPVAQERRYVAAPGDLCREGDEVIRARRPARIALDPGPLEPFERGGADLLA